MDDWNGSNAAWIAAADAEKERNLYLEFARRFQCDLAADAPVVVRICAVSLYRLSVNRVVIGRGPAVSDPLLRFYHQYEVPAGLLREGENLLTVLLFHDGETTETVQGFRYGKPGLLLDARCGSDGHSPLLVSDATWRVRRSPVYSARPQLMPTPAMLSKWGGYKELYNGERADDWESPSYDHSGWETALVAAERANPDYAAALVPVGVPELEEETLFPARLVDAANNLGRIYLPPALASLPAAWPPLSTGAGAKIRVAPGDEPGAMPSLTLDYGAIVVGSPEIQVAGPPCRYEVWYGETLELLRCDVVHPDAQGRWRSFQRRAYRYIRLNFIALEGEIQVCEVRHHNAWYAYDRRGVLTLDDPLAQQIVEVTDRTQRANSSYHYEDCPVREQALWVMDMRIMALVNAYRYGNHELTAKCLRQCFALQRPAGSVPSTGPRDSIFAHPDFMMHLTATLREYYQHTGDRPLVAALLPGVRRIAAYLGNFKADSGLLDTDLGMEDAFLDWSSRIEKRGQTTILNALYTRFLGDVAALETLCGEAGAAKDFHAEANAVGAAINRRLFWEERGVYRDAVRGGQPRDTISQQANLAALYAGIVPDARVDALLAEVWQSPRYPRPFGPSFYVIVLEALALAGRRDAVWPLLKEYWGAMLRRGATTWWEVFDPTTPEWCYPHTFLGNVPTFECDWIPISACHGWSNAPGYAIPRYLLGVDLSHVADGRIHIDPALPEGWKHIRYAVPVAGGVLRLEFYPRGDGGGSAVEVLESPQGIEIVLPH